MSLLKMAERIRKEKLEAMVENIADYIVREDRMPLLSDVAQMIGRSVSTASIWLNIARERNLIDWSRSDRFYYVKGVYLVDKRDGSHNSSIRSDSHICDVEVDGDVQP